MSTITDKVFPVAPSWTSENEREKLERLAKEVGAGGLIVEIGCLYGGVTAVMALANSDAKVTTIDDFSWTPDGYPTASKERVLANLKILGVQNVTIIVGKSYEVSKEWKRSIQLCFIDGGHSFEYVYGDLCTFAPFSEVVALHDFDNPGWPDIRMAIEQFLPNHPEWNLSEVTDMLAVLRHI